MNITRKDSLGRLWTITASRAVVGHEWTVYVHARPAEPEALAELEPGGVAHGWSEEDLQEETLVAQLGFTMSRLGGNVRTPTGVVDVHEDCM